MEKGPHTPFQFKDSYLNSEGVTVAVTIFQDWRCSESTADDALQRPACLKLILSDSAPGRAQSGQVGCSALAVAR